MANDFENWKANRSGKTTPTIARTDLGGFKEWKAKKEAQKQAAVNQPAVQNGTDSPRFVPNTTLSQYNPSLLDRVRSYNLKDAFSSGVGNSVIGKFALKVEDAIMQKSYEKVREKGQLPYDIPEKASEYIPKNTAEKIAAGAGTLLTDTPLWIAGEGAISAAASKVAPALATTKAAKVASKVPAGVKPILAGGLKDAATYGAVVAPSETLAQGGGLKTLAEKEQGLPFVLGGGIALRGLGAGISKAISLRRSPKAEITQPQPFKQVKYSTLRVPKVDSVYKSQYNNIDDIKRQISKYYDGVTTDKGMIDNAAQAITDLKRTESLHTGGSQAGNGLNGLRGDSGALRGQKPYQTVGKAFSDDLINTGKVNLVGNQFNDVKDLATLTQVYRDPRFETFRIVYTNNGTIVGTEAISSRMPGSSIAFIGNKDKFVGYLKNKMGRVKADGYYLLHNHPGKTVKPSPSDIALTNYYANNVAGFKGHIIINSNKYTEIIPISNRGGIVLGGNEDLPLNLGNDILYNPSIPHPLLGSQINGTDVLAKIAKQVQIDNNMSTAFFIDAQNNIRGIMEISNGMLKNTQNNNFRNFLRNQAIEHGGRNVFLIGDKSVKQQIGDLIQSGDVLDGVISGDIQPLRYTISPSAAPNTWMGKSEAYGKLVRPAKPYETPQGFEQVGPAVSSVKTIMPMNSKLTPKDIIKNNPQPVQDAASKNFPELKVTSKINRATQMPIWEARPSGRLTKKDLIRLEPEMEKLGGFYSKTSRSFVFDKDPTAELKKLADVKGKQAPFEEKILTNSDLWKDKSMVSYNRETLERNLEDIAGEDAPELIKTYVEPRQKAVADMTRFLNTERNELTQLGIKPRSRESELLQKFGEGKYVTTKIEKNVLDGKDTKLYENHLYSLDDLKRDLPDTWENVVKANTMLRQKYDKYLEMANEVLERNGYDPIPKREDYFKHFQEITDKLEMFGIPSNKLPTDINGLTADFQPGKTFFSSFLPRKGSETALDAMAGIDKYLDGISKVIYLTDDIQRLRSLESAVRKKYGDGETQLSNLVAYLREYTNSLAGKKSLSDRGMESDIGRNVYRAADALKKQVGANAIGFNISSALTNFIPLTQSLATTSKPAFIKGMMETVANVFKNDGFINRSDFLTRRFGSDPLAVKLWTNRTDLKGNAKALGNLGATYSKVRDSSFWMFDVLDKFVAQTIVRGKYNELLSTGISPEAALKQADDWGGRILADRSIGAMPNFFNKKGIMGAFTQFQLEVNNQLSFMFKDIPRSAETKAAAASAIGQVFLYGYLFNSLFEKATGRRPAFDPIGVVQQAYEDYTNPELKVQEANKNLMDNIFNQLPFSSLVSAEGGRIPLSDALPNPRNVLLQTSTVDKELSKLPKLVLPAGGGQLKKTTEGLTALNQNPLKPQPLSGKYKQTEEGSQLVYPIAKTPANIARGSLFGQYAFPEAKEYYENSRTPLTPKQTEIVETMAENGADPKVVYDQLMLLRPLKKKEEEEKSIVQNPKLTLTQKDLLYSLLYYQ